MKVLTNIRFYTVAGIAQYLSSFIRHNEKGSSVPFAIYGVDMMLPAEQENASRSALTGVPRFRLITKVLAYPDVGSVVKAASSIEDVRAAYAPVIAAYRAAIEEVRPDVVLINGTFFLPWCLLQAAKDYGRARIIVHYHGVLMKEVEHWKEENAKQRFMEMEREFDVPGVSYVFPSAHARRVVEHEVFGHPIAHAVVLPNPVPETFFRAPKRIAHRVIGMVSRWTRVKNPNFLLTLARHNRKTGGGYDVRAISDLAPSSPRYRTIASALSLMPPVENRRLPSFYRTLGALIMPSFFETYGNVAQEAIAAGVPALVSPQSGVAETMRAVGLEDWVTDFTSPAEVLARLEAVIHAGVPQESWERLRDGYASRPIFTRYASILSGAGGA